MEEIKKLNRELEQKVIARTAELEKANVKLKQQVEDLERWKKATIKRELRMKELRNRIDELEKWKRDEGRKGYRNFFRIFSLSFLLAIARITTSCEMNR